MEYVPDTPSLELKKLAIAFRHSAIMSKKYVRSSASELKEDSIANYDDRDLADKDEQEFSSPIPKTLVQDTPNCIQPIETFLLHQSANHSPALFGL